MNELTVVEQIHSLFSPADIELLEKFDEIETKVKVLKKERNAALLPLMEQFCEETGKKTLNMGRLSITYKKGTTRKSVDVEALKEQGLYESFLKESPVAPSVTVSVDYE